MSGDLIQWKKTQARLEFTLVYKYELSHVNLILICANSIVIPYHYLPSGMIIHAFQWQKTWYNEFCYPLSFIMYSLTVKNQILLMRKVPCLAVTYYWDLIQKIIAYFKLTYCGDLIQQEWTQELWSFLHTPYRISIFTIQLEN